MDSGSITITTEKGTNIKKIRIKDMKNIWQQILILYQLGYDEIEIMGDIDLKVLHILITEKMLGFEVIMVTDKSCIVKCVSELNFSEFNNLLKRALLLLSSAKVEQDSYKKDAALKLIYACKRIISKGGYKSLHKSLIMYVFLDKLKIGTQIGLRDVYNLFQKYEAYELKADKTSINPLLIRDIAMVALSGT